MPIGSCEEERQKLIVEDKSVSTINYKQELKNVFQLLGHSDIRNRYLAIKLAKSVLNLDCYDLCQCFKKNIIFNNNTPAHRFIVLMNIIDYLMNGWEVEEAAYCLSPDLELYSIVLKSGSIECKMSLDKQARQFVHDVIAKDYQLKNYSYRYLLLNWDR